MIDYIDAIVPMKHNNFIGNGHKTVTKKDGSERKENYPIYISGKGGSSIKIKSVIDAENMDEEDVEYEFVRITGNLAMFIQGQSVYGTDDLLSLGYKAFSIIAKKLVKWSNKAGHFQRHIIMSAEVKNEQNR
ncbi:phage/plasmid replication domain-containing protein [Methylovulum psychrotolerans]|uniref:Replication-associated protein G2P N-terminal domain-containing protein n=1 Tax=Methylovulum psychrotolerans TaxID=1704499 RepID=A0A1Z4C2I4_9GAMM|nr:phage/plasmid replication protein [Methylovulum psychrotolerans]ASF47725.1 hypothetical protein CEK71_17545 [Methylovulum psychrotolerans]